MQRGLHANSLHLQQQTEIEHREAPECFRT